MKTYSYQEKLFFYAADEIKQFISDNYFFLFIIRHVPVERFDVISTGTQKSRTKLSKDFRTVENLQNLKSLKPCYNLDNPLIVQPNLVFKL